MGLLGDPTVEPELIIGSYRKTGVVRVSVDVVGLDRVEAGVAATIEANGEEGTDRVDGAHVEPAFFCDPW